MSFACCRMFVVRMYPLDAVPTDSSDGAVLLSRLPYFGNPHSRRRSRSRRERFAVLHAGVGRNDNVRRACDCTKGGRCAILAI